MDHNDISVFCATGTAVKYSIKLMIERLRDWFTAIPLYEPGKHGSVTKHSNLGV